MQDTSKVERMITPTIESMGYEVVRVQLQGTQNPTLQIMIERTDRAPITVEDCADVSHAVSAVLDVEDPIGDAYRLEVSSPGLDRPLTRLEHFERFAGFEARVETKLPVDGRKRFRGVLRGVADGAVMIDTDQGAARIPVEDIQRAKLVLTDELIAAAQAEQERSGGGAAQG
ncbi:MAG TPA: ribosome maturation factor RimP [Azospirillaceae bacterium]|nr:ribosome maturation factor RimP [Azospirillaceae bacterium]